MTLVDFLSILASALRLSTPLLLACLAGLYSERAGVFDIGLEGKMLAAAFAAAATATMTGSAPLGLLMAIMVSVALALVHGFASITQGGNQIVSGVAINTVAIGLTAVLGNAWFKEGGRTPSLVATARFQPIELPFAGTIRDLPIIGPIYSNLLSGHHIFVYLALLAVPLTAFVLGQTRFGLRLRAVGENPAALDTAGVSVVAMRYKAVICCGVLCGLAGCYMSAAQSASFVTEMTAGKGFIALAALIFAKWRPWNALWACLLFGVLEALAIRLEGSPLPGIGQVPVQIFHALPYVLTIVLLAGFIGKAQPPRAGGVPYVKERR
jgi:simple sugar transport system permease protein